MKRRSLAEFLLDFAMDAGDKIRKKKQRGQRRINVRISDETYRKFIRHVKDDHFGVVNGPLSLETEKAMILYLHFYKD